MKYIQLQDDIIICINNIKDVWLGEKRLSFFNSTKKYTLQVTYFNKEEISFNIAVKDRKIGIKWIKEIYKKLGEE